MELRETGVKITSFNLLRTKSSDGSVITVIAIWLHSIRKYLNELPKDDSATERFSRVLHTA
jgi:hypothetical protein